MEDNLSATIVTYATSLGDSLDSAFRGEIEGIFALTFFALVFCCLYSISLQLRIRNWPMTKGNLVEAGLVKFGSTERQPSEIDYTTEVSYQYEVNQRQYTSNKLSPWVVVASHNMKFLLEYQLKGLSRGGRVEVFFDPRNPERAYLRRPGILGVLFTSAFALFCLATPVLIFG